jgi:hypothetical protein
MLRQVQEETIKQSAKASLKAINYKVNFLNLTLAIKARRALIGKALKGNLVYAGIYEKIKFGTCRTWNLKYKRRVRENLLTLYFGGVITNKTLFASVNNRFFSVGLNCIQAVVRVPALHYRNSQKQHH